MNGNVVAEQFKDIDKQVAQYPTLIYDGPFSDNTLNIKPRIENQKVISEKQAMEIAKTIVGKDKVESISGKSNQGKPISTYSFTIAIKGRTATDGDIVCEISKNGGKVVYLLDNRKLNKATINLKVAVAKGIII